jgi:hypothetical protein
MEDNKYYGVYRGTCYDNADPQNEHRIILLCPQVLGSQTSNWAHPLLPVTNNSTHDTHTETYTTSSASVGNLGSHTHTVTLNSSHSGHTGVPHQGQSVWVMFEGGDSNFPIWVGVF